MLVKRKKKLIKKKKTYQEGPRCVASQALFVIVGHHVGGSSSLNDILPSFGPFCVPCFMWCWIFFIETLLRGVAGVSSAMVMEVVATVPKTYIIFFFFKKKKTGT